jgi:hypothetical protein
MEQALSQDTTLWWKHQLMVITCNDMQYTAVIMPYRMCKPPDPVC